MLSPSAKMFVLGGDTWWQPSKGKDKDTVMCSWDSGVLGYVFCLFVVGFFSNSFQVNDDNLHRLRRFGE